MRVKRVKASMTFISDPSTSEATPSAPASSLTRRDLCKGLCFVLLLSKAARSHAVAPSPLSSVDPRGPIPNVGILPTVDKAGVQTHNFRFADQCKKPSAWTASWIWLNGKEFRDKERTGGSAPLAALFRKEITLHEAPRQVLAWMSGDIKYRFYINGHLISRGPADIGRDYSETTTQQWFYDHRELTPFFRVGKNVLAAEVFTEKLVWSEVSTGYAGLLFEAELRFEDGKHTTLQTDTTWRGIAGEQWRMASWPPDTADNRHLQFDARKEPIGWRLPGFEDRDWPLCEAAGDHWQPLVASEIPPLMEAVYSPLRMTRSSTNASPSQTSPPTSAPANKALSNKNTFTLAAGERLTISFDRVFGGYIGLKVKGGLGAILAIQPNETAAPGFHRMASIQLRDGVQTVELPFLDSFSAIHMEAANVTTPIEILDVRAVFASQPVGYRGAFSCSDPTLTRLWHVARWATQICLQTHHLDSPHHQEPICDPGDYMIESLVNYAAFGQPWLTRQDLRKYARLLVNSRYRPFHTSYALLWLQMLLDYYDYTGDGALLTELAPQVHGLLDTFTSYRGKSGLLTEAPNYMFMDWLDIAGFPAHHPPCVIGQGYMTAFYYRALRDARRVADFMQDAVRVATYNRIRREVAEAFNRELWSEAKGLYRDGRPFQTSVPPGQWLPADKDIETFTPHVNTLAVLYDLASADRKQAIMNRILTDLGFNCQPYFMHFVLSALAHAGLFAQHGLPQLRRWKVVEETQSLREMWDSGDLSHGWGATPLYQLSTNVLGVRPITPGCKTLTIRPQCCDLDWARGTVPTPQGEVQVEWQRTPQELRMAVTIPAGHAALLALPLQGRANAHVTVNGKPLWQNDKPAGAASRFAPQRVGNTLVARLSGGTYRFVVS